MKRAIRYLRFSQLGQSNSSIERQELYTDQWLINNKVELVDTFIDRGKSARTFDRPDFNKLKAFIDKHYKSVDYLLVDQLDRFSRDAGEAMSMVKLLQKKYACLQDKGESIRNGFRQERKHGNRKAVEKSCIRCATSC